MILRRTFSFVAVLLALGAAGCGGEPDTGDGTAAKAESSALNRWDFTCKPPVGGTSFHCPQAGCCLLKNNFTSPPTYSCYDCR